MKSTMMWWRILYTALKRNGWKQLFFYLSNLDVIRFIELSKTIEFLDEKCELILELGCGYSVLPAILSNECKNYVCLDLSKGACKYQASLPNVSTVIADMQYLPFKTRSIPTIVAISSIEHVPDDKMVFKEISRVSKKDSELILSIPYSNSEVKIIKLVHPKFMLDALHKFDKFWNIILGKHLNYFIEQTSTDSFMKCYNMAEINELARSNNLCVRKYYLYEKYLQQKFFGIIPKGWFVPKDLVLGWILYMIEDSILESNTNGKGIITMITTCDTVM